MEKAAEFVEKDYMQFIIKFLNIYLLKLLRHDIRYGKLAEFHYL